MVLLDLERQKSRLKTDPVLMVAFIQMDSNAPDTQFLSLSNHVFSFATT